LKRLVIDASTLVSGITGSRLESPLRDLRRLAGKAGAEAIVTSDRDLLDHDALNPPAIDPRTACKLLALID
jgi:hypothetical protein